MAGQKISKVAKELNVSVGTVVEALKKNDIIVPEDNPNFRLTDDQIEILNHKFKGDKDQKNKSSIFLSQRHKEKRASQNVAAKSSEPVKIEVEPISRPKFIGKIDLTTGKAITEEPKDNPVNTVIPEDVKKTTPTNIVEDKKTSVVEEKKRDTVEKKPEEAKPSTEEKKFVEDKVEKQSEKELPQEDKKPAPVVTSSAKEEIRVKPTEVEAKKVEKETPKSQEDKSKEPEIFTYGPKIESPVKLNVVGKIDLSSLNQSTRPKKKSKEERKQEKGGNGQNADASPNSSGRDRKKRRRINGKEKIDIEKAASQQKNKETSNNRKDGKNKNKQNRPVHVEVSEEDVQKQVRETLARLTSKDKGLKKGVKWRKEKREAFASREKEQAEQEAAQSTTLQLTEFVTANDLASMMDVPINQVIATCMNLGVMVSINQRLDAETINIVAEEFGFKTEYVSAEVVEAIAQEEDSEEDLTSRPPIVTVMGHVDHGKTSLLDYIRNANVIAGEAGGITQHIGAYNVKLPDGRRITFLDTPGHEAFTAMRARGAKVTDLVIIIVAADDNVMPQTVEAINHASAAGVPIVFAINKIDKPNANPDKIKEALAGMNYLVEDWGGKYQSQDISAKKGIGVEELMEKVLLEAEMLDLKANPDKNAVGSIIESSLDKGRGYVATVLVQNGTLHVGDTILAGVHYGKIKAMFNERNQRIKEAGPATPALILGLNGAPTAGDTFNVLDTEQEAREIASKREQLQRELGLRTRKLLSLEDIGRRRAIGNFQELNIIVKGDVDGSIEALSDSLIKLSTEEIQVNVIHKAVGEISESDVTLAAASDAIIIGFQVRPSIAARKAAEREGVEIRLYSIIYQAIEEVKDAMAGMLEPELKEEITGSAEVMNIFHNSKVGTIAGCLVREGKLKRGAKVRLIRDGIVKYTGELGSLKRFKEDVKEVLAGYDCGMSIVGYNDIKVGDFIEGYEEVEVNRTL